MAKILKYIAKETQGECFTSFKYCYDTLTAPTIEYENGQQNFINLKEYAEEVHDPKPRNLIQRATICLRTPPYFLFSLMALVEYIRLMIFNTTNRSSQL